MQYVIIGVVLILAACAAPLTETAPAPNAAVTRLAYTYEPSQSCKGCHPAIHAQYEESEHAKAFENPVFKSLYFKEVVPRAERDPGFRQEAKRCVYCHAPVAYMNYTGLIRTPQQVEGVETGVTCDFCHTLAGYEANGDYRQNPSGKKQGPFEINNWHTEFSGWIQLSEFCGPCHNAENHHGIPVKATYAEWRQSNFATAKVTCQECHMNRIGYLRNGKAEFYQGAAAHLTVGYSNENKAQDRSKIYSHRFPGAHTNSQIAGAIGLKFSADGHAVPREGAWNITLDIDNSRTGHHMPSGSTDLRFLWLEVTAATADGRAVPVRLSGAAPAAGTQDFGRAGSYREDMAILGTTVPSGSRLYRAVYLDAEGNQALMFYNAASRAFDNRLQAGEVRREQYQVQLPVGYTGPLRLKAVLYYKGAPDTFTSRLGVDPFSAVRVAAVETDVRVGAVSP